MNANQAYTKGKNMASLYQMFSASEDAAENGKWFEFGDTIKVKIRRFKSKKSRKVREELEAPFKRASKFSVNIPEDSVEDITNRHVAKGVIADWSGVTDPEGVEIAYSWQAALKLVEDLPEFRDAVIEISLGIDNFREEVKEDVSGN